MARIKVKKQGQNICILVLEKGQEYFAGRNPDCHIVLDAERGVSRQHFKIEQQAGVWTVTSLSRFGNLLLSGHSQSSITLDHDLEFSVPPFDFEYTHETEPEIRPVTELEKSLLVSPKQSTIADATLVSGQSLDAVLRIAYNNGSREDVTRLVGHYWVAGRDPLCEIPLQDDHVSRRHFELSRTHEGYFVTDLGSANGTLLNDERLPANEPFQLVSGDVLKASQVLIYFQIRDSNYQNRLAEAASSILTPLNQSLPQPFSQPAVVKLSSSQGRGLLAQLNHFDWRKHKVRVILAGLTPLLLYGLFSGESPSKKSETKDLPSSSTGISYDSLSAQQKRAIKDSFGLAKTLYIQAKYELCLSEIKKIHEIVPAFENSKEIESYCVHGMELVLRERDRERKEQERAEIEGIISAVVQDCRQQFAKATSLEDLRLCLAPAIERNPEHPMIKELEQMVLTNEEQRQDQRRRQLNAKKLKATGQGLLDKARRLSQRRQHAEAIDTYEKFLRGNYPALTEEKTVAQREVAQVRKELLARISALVASCKDNLAKSKFKDALLTCEAALKEEPSNSEAKGLKQTAASELRRELKSIYEDSVLEESMGNVDTTKEKWRLILQKSLPGEEYYNKAKRSLQKYGL